MLLIIIHELGHILISLIFKWNIDKIIILPFGGLTKYNEIINRPLIEEFLISVAGITFQIIFYRGESPARRDRLPEEARLHRADPHLDGRRAV